MGTISKEKNVPVPPARSVTKQTKKIGIFRNGNVILAKIKEDIEKAVDQVNESIAEFVDRKHPAVMGTKTTTVKETTTFHEDGIITKDIVTTITELNESKEMTMAQPEEPALSQ